MSVQRAALRWHGGKFRDAPWIISFFPPHRRYVDPYAGAGSVLFRKPRCFSEIYNDLDDQVVTFFRVLRSPDAPELIERLRLTPFARSEFELASEPTDDPIEIARRLAVRSYMGFGSDSAHSRGATGFRAQSKSNRSPEKDWYNYPEKLPLLIDRLRGVVIENRPALDVMRRFDAEDCLFYVDPPYLPETRSQKSRKGGQKYHAYAHEMSTEDHAELLEFLCTVRGMVVLSGYPSDFYDSRLPGWEQHERTAFADGARPRIEKLWLNPAASEARIRQQTIFDEIAA